MAARASRQDSGGIRGASPALFTVDDEEYCWRATIESMACDYSVVTQSRAGLPDPIGAVVWYGASNPDATCCVPFYAGVAEICDSMNTSAGSHLRFTRESYWWAITAVSTVIELKWSCMIRELEEVRRLFEGGALGTQQGLDSRAVELFGDDPALAVELLTCYCNSNAEEVRDAWWSLLDGLIWKYHGATVVDEGVYVKPLPYPEAWLERVIQTEEPDYLRR